MAKHGFHAASTRFGPKLWFTQVFPQKPGALAAFPYSLHNPLRWSPLLTCRDSTSWITRLMYMRPRSRSRETAVFPEKGRKGGPPRKGQGTPENSDLEPGRDPDRWPCSQHNLTKKDRFLPFFQIMVLTGPPRGPRKVAYLPGRGGKKAPLSGNYPKKLRFRTPKRGGV